MWECEVWECEVRSAGGNESMLRTVDVIIMLWQCADSAVMELKLLDSLVVIPVMMCERHTD